MSMTRIAIALSMALAALQAQAAPVMPPPDEAEGAHAPSQAPSTTRKLEQLQGQTHDSRRIPLKRSTSQDSAPEAIRLPPIPNDEFAEGVRQEMPFTPEQIRFLRKTLDQTQRATAETPYTPAKPVASSYTVDLSPGATPAVVRLGTNYVTSIVFVDITGERWPIVSYAVGNEDSFDVQDPDKDNKAKDGNALTVISNTAYGSGNISVFLRGLSTPVTITLVSGQKEIDYRADMRIKARGPFAQAPEVSGDDITNGDPLLLGVLDGLMPSGSRELRSADSDVRAWSYGGKMYVRSRMKLQSPAWLQSRRSPDGMNAYVTKDAPVLVMTSQKGERLVRLSGFVWSDPSKGQSVKQVGLPEPRAAAPRDAAAMTLAEQTINKETP